MGIKNGALILLAIKSGFTIFITNDQNLDFQQYLGKYKILFININQTTNRYEDILPVILYIKEWILKNKKRIKILATPKNYLKYKERFCLIKTLPICE
ncbi:MAG: hypothetical protein WKF59_17495 [Chitinophagaceae bacterium]